MPTAPLLTAAVLLASPGEGYDPLPPGVGEAEVAAVRALDAKLAGPAPDWPAMRATADGGSFGAAVRALGAAAGVTAVLDRPALAAAGADPAAPDALPFTPPEPPATPPASLRAAFLILLASQGGPELALDNRAGLLFVTTPDGAARTLTAKVYPLGNLTPDEAAAVTQVRTRVTQTVAGRRGGGDVVTDVTRLDPPLVAALYRSVAGPGIAAWENADGPAAAVPYRRTLIVRQTAAGHAAVAGVLDALQTATADLDGESARETAGDTDS